MRESIPVEPRNPYDPPRASPQQPGAMGSETLAEESRSRYLGREYTLKMLGVISCVCAFLEFLLMAQRFYQEGLPVWYEEAMKSPGGSSDLLEKYVMVPIAILVQTSIGIGLLRLRSWGFWILIGHSAFVFLASILPYLTTSFWGRRLGKLEDDRWIFLASGLVQLLVLGYAIGSKSVRVVTPGYRNVILETPFLRRRWSWSLVGFIPITLSILLGHAYLVTIISWIIARACFPDWPRIWDH